MSIFCAQGPGTGSEVPSQPILKFLPQIFLGGGDQDLRCSRVAKQISRITSTKFQMLSRLTKKTQQPQVPSACMVFVVPRTTRSGKGQIIGNGVPSFLSLTRGPGKSNQAGRILPRRQGGRPNRPWEHAAQDPCLGPPKMLQTPV